MNSAIQASSILPPSVSVIVPVYNGGPKFRQCLLALTDALPAPLEIIVVADGDTDGSRNAAEAAGFRVIRLPTCGGPAAARNVGARQARGDILFFVDGDVLLTTRCVGQVAEVFQRKPDLAALFGSYDDEPSETNFLSQYKNLLHHYVHQTANRDGSTFWSGCGAIRREVFLALGGFDEAYRRASIEDIELGYRLKRAGYRIESLKSLQVKHLKRWGVISLLKSDFLDRALPWTELILRDNRFVDDLNLRPSSRISVMAVYGMLAAVAASLWSPLFAVIGGALLLATALLNVPLILFFFRKRGFTFTLGAFVWHCLYYAYCGLAFTLGAAQTLRKTYGAASSSIAGREHGLKGQKAK